MKFNGLDLDALLDNTPCMSGYTDMGAGTVAFQFNYWEGLDWFVEWCEDTDQEFSTARHSLTVVVHNIH